MRTLLVQRSVDEALRVARRALADQSPTPGIDAELLLAHVTGWDTARMIVNSVAELDAVLARRFFDLIEQRAAGTPVAYLVGEREFWSLPFRVSRKTLIPRPDTETLVQIALERLPIEARAAVLDLGTGSGNIAIAIARARPRALVCAVDADAQALAVAEENARRLDATRIEFVLSDWFSRLVGRRFDLLVSNPPYIAENDPHLAAGDLRFEPRRALVSGKEGLADIERILTLAPSFMNEGARLLMEHGHEQGRAVREMLDAAGYSDIQTHTDLSGLERVTECLADGGQRR